MPSLTLSILFCLILASSSSNLLPALADQRTAYEIIGDYDFPVGILPEGVAGYELDPSTGKFSAFWNSTCSFSLEGSYQLRYRSRIHGVISRGRLTDLQGVSVKLWFMWLDIVEVSRSGDDLDFSVGIAGAGFPVENFEISPQCGCGMNCGDEREIHRIRSNALMSSL